MPGPRPAETGALRCREGPMPFAIWRFVRRPHRQAVCCDRAVVPARIGPRTPSGGAGTTCLLAEVEPTRRVIGVQPVRPQASRVANPLSVGSASRAAALSSRRRSASGPSSASRSAHTGRMHEAPRSTPTRGRSALNPGPRPGTGRRPPRRSRPRTMECQTPAGVAWRSRSTVPGRLVAAHQHGRRTCPGHADDRSRAAADCGRQG